MEEEKAGTPDGEDQAPQNEPRVEAPRPPVERRDFIRRSAEVAALSLFGIGSLDPLIERVLARVGEMRGADQLTTAIARHLSESGVMTPTAHAARPTPECPSDYGLMTPLQEEPEPPPGPDPLPLCVPGEFHCTQAESFACNANTMPPFAGCKYPGFACEWGEQFYCQVDDAHFDCDKVGGDNIGFSCPPWAGNTAWFDCPPGQDPPAFTCDEYPGEFDCAGHAEGYLCPDPFTPPPCTPVNEWACPNTPSVYNEKCSSRDSQQVFWCGDNEDIFDCQDQQGTQRKFQCGDRVIGMYTFYCSKTFNCISRGSFDFICQGWEFGCGDVNQDVAFECQAGHLFECLGVGSDKEHFWCGGRLGFTCSGGGTRCGSPSALYNFDDGTPGDFVCDGGTGTVPLFRCYNTEFKCSGGDDFTCDRNAGTLLGVAFECTGTPFAGCQPSATDGTFRCDQATPPDFTCADFTCGPPTTRFAG